MVTSISVKSIRGLETGWISAGDPASPTIMLLLHGYPDTPESWDQQMDYFAQQFYVIAPYARGAAPSANSTELKRYSLDAVALDHLAILNEVDPGSRKEVILIGHDIGGAQAWHLAPLLGERLRNLIIINSLSIGQMTKRLLRNRRQLRKSWYIAAFMSKFVRQRWINSNPGKFLSDAHGLAQLPQELRPPLSKSIVGVVNPVMHYRAFLPDAIRSVLRRRSTYVDKPTLILWGTQDPFLEVISKDELVDECPKATIRILKGSHWIHREDSATVNRLIEEFICPSPTN